ncbi:AraC family transcriptional regulator [Actinomadura rupiterrae]|uniref:AraC family transcriptional regulator n=1 Tax=Actinomadura rupiterrae TaxID=559627 RepID=UPI0020A52D21|nr:helix-turn-helix domain-containing protein [Actinomadura rupiterrae]MCP2336519.1 AraC-like DNA-binding protein [Actinomadura rupiterrae]
MQWEVARPERPSRTTGISMAGFRDRGLSAASRRAIPHPSVTLVLEFGRGSLIVDGATGPHRGNLVAGLGLALGGVRIRGGAFEVVQVRLSPLVVHAVLGVPPAELDGAMVPLDALWGRSAERICARLAETSSWQDRFAITDAEIARRSTARAPDPEVAWAWRQIVHSRGTVRVDGLATELGWSRQRLWSRFRNQIGLPPKQAAKLVRFDHAVHRLVAGESPARVAADSGYADQSHLHRDVLAFSGETPVTVAREPFLAVDDYAWRPRA